MPVFFLKICCDLSRAIAFFFQCMDDLVFVFGSEGFDGNLQFHCCGTVRAYELVVIQFDHVSSLVCNHGCHAYQFSRFVWKEYGDCEDSVTGDEA